jgi:eukaryotic-like serine/threonine-protein kinase
LVYIDLLEGHSETARQEIRRLLRRAPNEPSVHSTAAYVYRLSGQYEKALAEWDALLKVSPTDVVYASYNRARIYGYVQDWAKAKEEIALGMAFEPNHPNLRTYDALIMANAGDIERAASIIEDVLAKNPELLAHKIYLAILYLTRGERQRAFDLLDDRVLETGMADQDVAYRIASLYALDHDTDRAMEWLERAVAMGNENYPWFVSDTRWDALRDHPRYRELLESLKNKWEELNQGS